jgi:hypothetical protein
MTKDYQAIKIRRDIPFCRSVGIVDNYMSVGTCGYIGGGNYYTEYSYAPYYFVEMITFSTSILSYCCPATLVTVTSYIFRTATITDFSTFGYWIGGTGDAATTEVITYSTRVTNAKSTSNLIHARIGLVGIGDGVLYGYVIGCTDVSDAVEKLTYSTGTFSAKTDYNLSVKRNMSGSLSDGSMYNSPVRGYIAGGIDTDTVIQNVTDEIIYSTGVMSAVTAANLPVAKHTLVGLSDGFSYGYFCGGISTAYSYSIAELVFSTSVTSAVTTPRLSYARARMSAISDGIMCGYIVCGEYTNYYSAMIQTIDKLTYSTHVISSDTYERVYKSRVGSAGISEAC